MRIYKDISLDEFKAWSGAVDIMDTLGQLENVVDYCVFDHLEDMLCADSEDEGMDETDLNDFLWFENDTIAEWLGYKDWEQLERVANGEDEEEEEEEEIELVYSVGDVVNYNGEKGVITEVDESDKDFSYLVQFNGEYKTYEKWCAVDEVDAWEDDDK